MAGEHHRRRTLTVSALPGGRRRPAWHLPDAGRRIGHLVTAWLGILVLAINLFGWILTPQQEDPVLSMDSMSVLVPGGMPMCEHSSNQHQRHGAHRDRGDRQDGNRGNMVCPACFPLGNCASGALVADPPVVVSATALHLLDRLLPGDTAAFSSFHSHHYRARAPPLPA